MININLTSSGGSKIGSFLLDYLIVKPINDDGDRERLSGSGSVIFKKKSHHRLVHSGHRGLGVGVRKDIPGYDEIQENTITSFNYAGSHGADMVELDVSLTKDHQVIVYHDLVVVDSDTGEKVAIRDLMYQELLSHRYQPIVRDVSVDQNNGQTHKLQSKNVADPDLAIFEPLSAVLQRVNPKTAINIEVKYPHPLKDEPGKWFPCQPFDINKYLDIILAQVADFSRDREIMFSSFEPDVCTSLKLKQTKYPSFLLTRNGGYDPPTSDEKRNNIELGIIFAAAVNLVGVNSYGEYILTKGTPFVSFLHKNLDLIVYCWEGPLTPTQLNTLIDMDVDGLCYDKIDLKRSQVKESNRKRQDNISHRTRDLHSHHHHQNVYSQSEPTVGVNVRSIWATAVMLMNIFV